MQHKRGTVEQLDEGQGSGDGRCFAYWDGAVYRCSRSLDAENEETRYSEKIDRPNKAVDVKKKFRSKDEGRLRQKH